MDYKDALEAALRAVRTGQDLESAIAPYPKHAARLRDDIALATRVRTAGSEAAPDTETAARSWARLSSELADRRTAPEPSRRFWHGLSQGMLLRGAVAAVVVIAVAAVIGLSTVSAPFDSSTAEAATVEGVVVENANGLLTLQTADGLSSVRVEGDASVTDESGRAVSLASIEAGQLILAKGQRLAQGEIAARTIARRPPPALDAWCGVNQTPCEALVQRIQQATQQCEQRNPAMCAALRGRLQAIRARLADISRLGELRESCEGGRTVACTELATFCRQHADLCKDLPDNLRRRIGPNQLPGR